jgi:hypothetical protein
MASKGLHNKSPQLHLVVYFNFHNLLLSVWFLISFHLLLDLVGCFVPRHSVTKFLYFSHPYCMPVYFIRLGVQLVSLTVPYPDIQRSTYFQNIFIPCSFPRMENNVLHKKTKCSIIIYSLHSLRITDLILVALQNHNFPSLVTSCVCGIREYYGIRVS